MSEEDVNHNHSVVEEDPAGFISPLDTNALHIVLLQGVFNFLSDVFGLDAGWIRFGFSLDSGWV